MHRLLPLLFVALIPAAVAAPVPRDVRPDFGSHGLLTEADLEKVTFNSRPVPENELKHGDVKEIEDEPQEKRGDDRPRPLTRYDIAVHIPWNRFLEGDVIPAYFVLRNNRGSDLNLHGRLALFGPEPDIWNSCDIDVWNVKTGEPVNVFGGKGIACGVKGALATVAPDGYYVVKGDLGRTYDRKPLPPGEYEVDWTYHRTRSAPVRFTVEPRNGAKPTALKARPGVHFYRLAPEFEGDERPEKVGEPFVWRNSHLSSIDAGEMASALAVGHGGAYVPDIHTVPAADQLVRVSLVWKPYRDADRVAITLHAVHPDRPVRFNDVPQLHLQLESDTARLDQPGLGEMARDAKHLTSDALVTPLTIEARLPVDWRARVGLEGTARLAVLVTSGEIELPYAHGERMKKLEVIRKPRGNEPPVWSGVVRTAFVDVQFPPPPPRPVLDEPGWARDGYE
jgi:hypothetical protein